LYGREEHPIGLQSVKQRCPDRYGQQRIVPESSLALDALVSILVLASSIDFPSMKLITVKNVLMITGAATS
jgi:hypothetical protein